MPYGTGSGGGSGTVSTASVVHANGFNGTVANPTTTPAITIKTDVTGLLKGNGTAVSAAVSGTDFDAPGAAAAAQAASDPSGSAATVNSALLTHAALSTSAHGGIVASSDSRLADSRTPTVHASTHAVDGSDRISPTPRILLSSQW